MARYVLATALLLAFGPHGQWARNYYGKLIGELQDYAHGIRGRVYAVNEDSIFIKGFSYDGTGPDAFFWVGKSSRPSPDGYIVPYPEDYKGREPPVLPRFDNENIILHLPAGLRLRDIKWLSVWCRRFTVNFGDLYIPEGLDPPRKRVLPEFKRLAHGLRSGNITILDAKTFYIPNLHYDGAGPDAYFWVGNGSEPSPLGIKVPNEIGSLEPLRGYQGADIEIQLPGNLTVYDIDWLAMWCVEYRHNFGHVMMPKDLEVPPALGQTKLTTTTTVPPRSTPLSNCREIQLGRGRRRIQVQWEKDHDQVRIRLTSRVAEKEYISFGISGDQYRNKMLGADVVVAFYDPEGNQQFRADDYSLLAYAQCDGQKGVCPDTRVGGRNDVTVEWGERKNGVLTVQYLRPLQTNDNKNYDTRIPVDREYSVIAAIGPVGSRKEAFSHTRDDHTTDNHRIDFSSRGDHNCVTTFEEEEERVLEPWPKTSISGETVFSARIGPTGGLRGYQAITGMSSWGIAWYINDRLIPEIYVERGQTYTFIVEGGNDNTNPARYHPFYITDSPEGGFGQKSQAEQSKQRVFAGVAYDSDGNPYPTAAGRYCEWEHKTIDMSSEHETFDTFFDTLRLHCEDGQPATLNWTVDPDTPNELYYQCYTHNNLGWKIHVVNPGFRLPRDGFSNGVSSILTPSFFIFVMLSVLLLR